MIPHAREHMRRKPIIALTGALVLAAALIATWTGVQLGWVRRPLLVDFTLPLHWLSGVGLILLYALHRRYGTHPAPWSRLAITVPYS